MGQVERVVKRSVEKNPHGCFDFILTTIQSRGKKWSARLVKPTYGLLLTLCVLDGGDSYHLLSIGQEEEEDNKFGRSGFSDRSPGWMRPIVSLDSTKGRADRWPVHIKPIGRCKAIRGRGVYCLIIC